LVDTIVRLAQNFVGSNNINLLEPIGQFGTRLLGGEDAASARYIYTSLRLGFLGFSYRIHMKRFFFDYYFLHYFFLSTEFYDLIFVALEAIPSFYG